MRYLLWLALSLLTLGPITLAQTNKTDKQLADCSKPLKACETPVKFLANSESCSCYACEYGKPKQYTVCTNNKEAKANLHNLAEIDFEQLANAPIRSFDGFLVAADGSATLTDKSGKKWYIVNPGFGSLKSRLGQKVVIKGHADDENHAIRVLHVESAPRESKDTGGEGGL